jgi:hypothetical protein
VSDPIDPQEQLQRMHDAAPQYAKAKANRVYMEEFRKTLKAQLMKACGVDAIGAQEREAYAHVDYLKHLEALRAAVHEEEHQRWRLVYAQAAIDVWRSQNASNRNIDRSAA